MWEVCASPGATTAPWRRREPPTPFDGNRARLRARRIRRASRRGARADSLTRYWRRARARRAWRGSFGVAPRALTPWRFAGAHDETRSLTALVAPPRRTADVLRARFRARRTRRVFRRGARADSGDIRAARGENARVTLRVALTAAVRVAGAVAVRGLVHQQPQRAHAGFVDRERAGDVITAQRFHASRIRRPASNSSRFRFENGVERVVSDGLHSSTRPPRHSRGLALRDSFDIVLSPKPRRLGDSRRTAHEPRSSPPLSRCPPRGALRRSSRNARSPRLSRAALAEDGVIRSTWRSRRGLDASHRAIDSAHVGFVERSDSRSPRVRNAGLQEQGQFAGRSTIARRPASQIVVVRGTVILPSAVLRMRCPFPNNSLEPRHGGRFFFESFEIGSKKALFNCSQLTPFGANSSQPRWPIRGPRTGTAPRVRRVRAEIGNRYDDLHGASSRQSPRFQPAPRSGPRCVRGHPRASLREIYHCGILQEIRVEFQSHARSGRNWNHAVLDVEVR